MTFTVKRSGTARWLVVVAAMSWCLVVARDASAQTAPTPEQRRQASAAYDSGVAARAQGNHASAASFFETADRLAPSPPALGNAIRSHRDAHSASHDARAASLCLRLLARYPDDVRMGEYARRVIAELGPALSRINVQCGACEVEVDGSLMDHEVFVEPGNHVIVGYWGSRTQRRELTTTAGATEAVAIEAPAEAAGSAVAVGGGTGPGAGSGTASGGPPPGSGVVVPPERSSRGILPPAVFVAAAAATVVSGAVLVWSTVDMYAGVGPYETAALSGDPRAPMLLSDGQGRELRTNILIGTTAGLGALTIGALVLTRWSGGRVDAAPVAPGPTGLAPGLTVGGRF